MDDHGPLVENGALGGVLEDHPLVEQVPAPGSFALVQLLAAVEGGLDDMVTTIPETDDIPRQERLDGRLAILR